MSFADEIKIPCFVVVQFAPCKAEPETRSN